MRAYVEQDNKIYSFDINQAVHYEDEKFYGIDLELEMGVRFSQCFGLDIWEDADTFPEEEQLERVSYFYEDETLEACLETEGYNIIDFLPQTWAPFEYDLLFR